MAQDNSDCSTKFHVAREREVIWVSGTVTDNRPHKHHALQVTWSAPGTRVRLTKKETTFEGACVLVEGGVTHAIELDLGLICLIDSESALAQRFRSLFLVDSEVAVIEDSIWSGNFQDAEELIDNVTFPPGTTLVDARVRGVLDWLDTLEESGQWATVSLQAALRLAHLSESRFLHLFSQEVGSPWRTYLVWRRALVAIRLASGGASLTESAHAAGYSDSAHLSRQFASLFGMTPAAFVNNSHFVQS